MSNPFAGMEIPSPAFSLDEVAALLGERYGLSGPLRSLGSHQDQNVMVDAALGRFILKISNPGFSHEGLQAQNAAMLYLSERDVPFRVPVPLPDKGGNLIGSVSRDGADDRRHVELQGDLRQGCCPSPTSRSARGSGP